MKTEGMALFPSELPPGLVAVLPLARVVELFHAAWRGGKEYGFM